MWTTDVAESVGSFEGMLQEAVSSLDLSGIDQVLLAVSMLCKLIHDTAWVYFIDKDALEAEVRVSFQKKGTAFRLCRWDCSYRCSCMSILTWDGCLTASWRTVHACAFTESLCLSLCRSR